MAEPERPFGARGDLVEQLVPIATDLVETMREHGPDAVRGVLLRAQALTSDQLDAVPGGAVGVLAMVCAAMIDREATTKTLLGWAEDLIEPGLAAERRRAIAAERHRLRVAGVRTHSAADALAGPVADAQNTTKDRMLRVVHGGRDSA